MAGQLLPAASGYQALVGVGGIGSGLFFALEGNHTLGRNESRPARLLDVRDYCKLHIIAHYVAVLMGARPDGRPFYVLPLGWVGEDAPGRALTAEMQDAGMDTTCIWRSADRPTLFGVCFQYPDGSGGNLTPADAACAALTPADVERAAPFCRRVAGQWMALAAPEVPLGARARLLELATRHSGYRAAALTSAEIRAGLPAGFLEHVDLLAVNEDEGSALIGHDFTAAEAARFLEPVAVCLTRCNPAMRIIVTAGPHGAYGFEGGRWVHCPGLEVAVQSTAGAGDALLGGVLAALAAGAPFLPEPAAQPLHGSMSSALELGLVLSAYKVTSPHSIHPETDLSRLLDFAAGRGIRVAGGLAASISAPPESVRERAGA